MDVTISLNVQVGEPTVGSGWLRAQVLPDWLSGAADPPFTVREVAPDPQVNRIGVFNDHKSHNKVTLNREQQVFWADLMAMHKFGKVLSKCSKEEADYIRNRFSAIIGPSVFLTNRPPTEDVRDYVNGTGQGLSEPALAALICGGCTVWVKPAGKNDRGVEMVEVYSFLDGEPLPSVTPETLLDPRVLWATTIFGYESVRPFSTLGEGVGVPYPLITKERYYYPASGVQVYPMDAPFRSQYYPPRSTYP